MAYTWIPFYKELAQKLFRFSRNRTPLVDWIYGNLQGYINHLKDAPDGRRVPDIDPFTVLAIINRGITHDKKREICKKFKNYLNISAEVPQDFNGVVEMNSKRSNFIAFEDKRKEGDIDRLWKVFEDAVLGHDIEESYNALEHQFLIKYNLTFALFWVRPDLYLPLDSNSQKLLFSLGITFDNTKFLKYQEYTNVMKRLTEKMRKESLGYSNYAEFSYAAYLKSSKMAKEEKKEAAETKKNYWIYAPGEQAVFWDIYYQEGVMGLGWDKIGDLKQIKSIGDLESQLKWRYNTDTSQDKNADMLYAFANEVKPGDVIYVKKGRKLIIGRGIVTSDYYYDKEREYQPHLRKVQWTDKGEWETVDYLPIKTLTNITGYKIVETLNSLIDGQSKVEEPLPLPTSDNYWWLVANPQIWKLSEMKVGEEQGYSLYNEKNNKRRIFQHFLDAKKGDKVLGYEARSTQEVVCLLEISKENDGEEIGFKKIETLPNPISFSTLKNTPGLEDMEYMINQQGSFFKVTPKEFEIVMKLARGEKPIEKENYSKEDFLKQVFVSQNDFERLESLLLRKKNLILQGAPGVGKTYAANRLAYAIMGEKDDDRIMQVQFHQNYSYEDFVMGYKPNDNGGFVLKPGKFYNFCKDAEKDRDHEYFFIIDEINRGNLSKIFGELLMLIESDYRDKEIELSYNDEKFSVPSNVYIIGMMNTADRSLAMIDYALRRRFSFFEMKPGFETPQFKAYIREKKDTKLDKLVNAIVDLNKLIESDDSLGSGFCIGHSYLCELGTKYNLDSIVEYDIIPMLREYWFDNNERFNQEALKLRNALIE